MSSSVAAFERYIGHIRCSATGRRYATAAKMFLEWYGRTINPDGGTPIVRAPRDMLMQYSTFLLEQNYNPSTIQAHLAGIQRYLKWIQTKVAKVELPRFHKPELPRQKRKVKSSLSSDVLAEFFQITNRLSEPMRTAALLLPCSGLRSEEMVTLPLGCLKRITVELDNGRSKDVLILRVTGKGGHERVVPLLDEGAAYIVQYLRGWRRSDSSTRWLFPTPSERLIGHLSTRTLRRVVQTVSKEQGREFTPHSMRRTYLTTLFRQGITPTVLAKLAGHGDVQVLINHYLDLNESDLARSVHSAGGTILPQH